MGFQTVVTVKLLKKVNTKVGIILYKKLFKILRKNCILFILLLYSFFLFLIPVFECNFAFQFLSAHGLIVLIIKKMVYVTRKEHFNAAHRVYNPSWSDEENTKVFGICANPNYHGHNFELIVTVKGAINPDTGFVVDMKKLGDLMKSTVIDKVDHRNLNLDVDFMQGVIPSCENFVVEIWKILEKGLKTLAPHVQLHYLKLIETPKNYVEYYGE